MLHLNPEFEKYIIEHTTAEDPVLSELNRCTHLETVYPQMIAGHLQGKLLEMISRMISPTNILEIGTFTGYSAICLAKGLADDGHLYTIEKNDEMISIASSFFAKSKIAQKITRLQGDALEIIPALDIQFDLVYIDGEKTEYPEYYRLVINKLRDGGWLLADNVLWGEKILKKTGPLDKSTRGIREFNELIRHDNRVENLILPIRDGVMLIRKK
ncbi:MAG: methyltransferase [Bacteroides sp. SM23_62_1]|nr:MAG: methyltransferase [Bacteroides sp. SM23_62_1]